MNKRKMIEVKFLESNPARTQEVTGLSQSLEDQTVIKLVLNAVQNVDWANLESQLKARYECQPRMLLTLLAYCYASGIYGSQQIHQAVRDNPMVRYICAKEFPDERTIRKFRKENRVLINQCLNQIFTQAWALKFDQGEADFLGFDWFESVLTTQIRLESLTRIDLATFIDKMQWDAD